MTSWRAVKSCNGGFFLQLLSGAAIALIDRSESDIYSKNSDWEYSVA
jgi:hypothetical protein